MVASAHIGIAGGGAWGTALAQAAARAGCRVTLWMRDEADAAAMRRTHMNAKALPGMKLEGDVQPTADFGRLHDCGAVLLAVPMQATRAVAEALPLVLRPGTPLINCAKGIDRNSGLFVTDLVQEVVRSAPVGVLSGPSFAADVAAGLPTALTLAFHDPVIAEALARRLGSPAFRIYHSSDVRGVEIGGAAKNVLAIAAGVVVGRGLGESARAALIARGFAELRRFGEAYAARPETLMGLSGLGDLLLTASSSQSRNYTLGLRIGGGMPAEEAIRTGKLAEGAFTASALMGLARARQVDMPIAGMVDALLQGWVTVDGALEALVNRPQKAE
jgi:glycerol-3-phosphate dehydrogenase (NAD(P)+)